MEQHIYIVFSSTPYLIGKAIRGFTREKYNHVSISLDQELTQMYSFARRFYRTPFYGGFVKESKARYHVKGVPAKIKICRLPVSEEDYEALAARLDSMYQRREQFLYNHLSVLTVPFHRLLPVRDTCICSEFVVQQLCLLGMPLNPKKYYSVGSLEKLLAKYEIYTGDALPAEKPDEDFFKLHPVPHFTTVRTFSRLLHRAIK